MIFIELLKSVFFLYHLFFVQLFFYKKTISITLYRMMITKKSGLRMRPQGLMSIDFYINECVIVLKKNKKNVLYIKDECI